MLFSIISPFILFGIQAYAQESHKITFQNNCGRGTPTLMQNGKALPLEGNSYTATGEFSAAIAYLQGASDNCGANGEKCTTLEITLNNGFSSADVTLIAPHSFSDPVGWVYTGGCDGQGAFCKEANCQMAFRQPTDYFAQVGCSASNVGITVTFCGSQDGKVG